MAAPRWEMKIQRLREESGSNRIRTVGTYQVFHDGNPVPKLAGMCLETRGPGDNKVAGNNRCVEAGSYPILTQDGAKYVTIGYKDSVNIKTIPRPGLHLFPSGKRVGILFHPGTGFLSSVGCINPTKTLKGPKEGMDYAESRARVIAIIDDLKAFLGTGFPKSNGKKIADAVITIADKA